MRHRTSDINRLRHWRRNIFDILCLLKGIPFDLPSTSNGIPTRFAYVPAIITCEASTKLNLFQQCASDVSDLAYITGSMPEDGSALNPR